MYLSHVVLEGGVFPYPPNAVYPTLTTAPLSLLLNASYPIPMAYYNNISDSGIHLTSSVPEGLEAYRFPCQVSTTENASDADGCPASSVPDELEAYPFPCQTSATENVSEADICATSSVPCELEIYPFLSRVSATEEVDLQTNYTLADLWSIAEQPGLLYGSTTSFGEMASYGTHSCHRSSRRLVSDARLQSRWLPPHTLHRSTAMTGSYTSRIINQLSVNKPNFTTQTFWVKIFPSPTWHQKYPLQS